MIYEAIDRQTGEVWAAFEAPNDERAGFRLRLECNVMQRDPERLAMHRARDGAYGHLGTAEIDFFPYGLPTRSCEPGFVDALRKAACGLADAATNGPAWPRKD
jgi:hypothetical protein